MKHLAIAIALSLMAMPATAIETSPQMLRFAEEQFTAWIAVPEVISAIKAQNERTSQLSQGDIFGLDEKWRAEVDATDTPFISEIMNNPLSAHLAENVEQTDGIVTEVFVMDARGLNVGQSAKTSDYWQGDEAKYQKTYLVGSGAVHMSEIELDESTQSYQGQISFSITDPETGAVIGAVTIGIDATTFF